MGMLLPWNRNLICPANTVKAEQDLSTKNEVSCETVEPATLTAPVTEQEKTVDAVPEAKKPENKPKTTKSRTNSSAKKPAAKAKSKSASTAKKTTKK